MQFLSEIKYPTVISLCYVHMHTHANYLLPGTGVVGLEGGAEGLRVLDLDAAFCLLSETLLLVGPPAEVGVSFLLGLETTKVTNPSVLFSNVAAYK